MQGRMLRWLRSASPGAVVLAASDEGLELIARHRAELLELGHLPMEADDEALLTMLDKERTYALAGEHGIPAPRVWRLRDRADVDAAGPELSYPCVLKPLHSHVFARYAKRGAKVLMAADPEELRTVFESMSAIGVELLATDVIAGPNDEYVSYYGYLDEQGDPLLEFTKRKIRQNPPHFGVGTYHATTHDSEVAEVGLRFLRAAGLRGLGNVEFKRDARDGQLKVIECNARFTMANELIRVAGIDLALFAYRRLLGKPTPPVDTYREDVRLLYPLEDALAFLRYRRNGELSFGRWAGSLLYRQHLPVARFDDPLPSLVRTSRQVRSSARFRDLAPRASRSHSPAEASGRRGPVERLRSKACGSRFASRLGLARSSGPGRVWRARRRVEPRLRTPAGRAGAALYEQIWREAAEAVGAEVEELAPGVLELTRGHASVRVTGHMVDLDDPVALELPLDRALALRARGGAGGIRLAEQLEFDACRPDRALAFLDGGGSCAVRPAGRLLPGATATVVASREELGRALGHPDFRGRRLLVTRLPAGDFYRLLMLDGELVDAVRVRPPLVTGDGRSTVEELIHAENEHRIAAGGVASISTLGLSFDVLLTLERAGCDMSSVPEERRTLSLGSGADPSAGGVNLRFDAEVSPQLGAEARLAQDAVGLRLAAVDVVTTDPTKALAETGGAITDVRGAPELHPHFRIADQEGSPSVAIGLLERLLRRAAKAPVA